MSRLKLSWQITIVFVLAFIITSILVVFFVQSSLTDIYENIVFERLETHAKAIAGNAAHADDEMRFASIVYTSQGDAYRPSSNLDDYVDGDAVRLMVNKVAGQAEGLARYTNTVGDRVINYVVLKRDGGIVPDDTVIVLTDDSMMRQMLRETSLTLLFYCLIAFAVGYVIVIWWVLKLARDTKSVSRAVSQTQTRLYKDAITTQRRDEIGDLATSIERMRGQIVENERQKQEIIQGVSHDLKTPIAVIQSYNEALKDGMAEKDEVVKVVEKEVSRLNFKVSELLNITRLEYIKLNKDTLGSTDMRELIEQIVPLYAHRTQAKIAVDLNDATFVGDKDSWRIVVQSVLDNAVRYAKDLIEIKLTADKLTIGNDGKTISETMLPKLFNAFEKSDDGEYGIGLSTARRTTAVFGYSISAANQKPGVVFSVQKKLA